MSVVNSILEALKLAGATTPAALELLRIGSSLIPPADQDDLKARAAQALAAADDQHRAAQSFVGIGDPKPVSEPLTGNAPPPPPASS